MDIDRFWQLIDQARAAAGPQADQAVRDFDLRDDEDPDRDYWDFDDADMQALVESARAEFAATGSDAGAVDDDLVDLDEDDGEGDEDEDEEDDITDPVALALYEQLAQLPAAEIAGFDNIFEDVRARAGQATMANAAVLIEHGFLGDDSFDDFRAGLVALGRTTFEVAVASPDSLAEHPLVREIAAANDPRWLGREDMLFVASHAYAAVTGEDEITFYDYAEGMRDSADETTVDGDEEEEWPITDEHEARRRLPRLSEMFYERSMRNRQRALDKLGLQS
jgi:Protein of unknown function (DUF4240)